MRARRLTFGIAMVVVGLGLIAAASAPMLAGAQSTSTFTARDPGVRTPNSPAAGGPIANLTANQTDYFNEGLARFSEQDAVANGLGPRFNMDSCAGCHAFPAVGGSSPSANPQMRFANAANSIPSFITADGPVREVRFVKNPDGTPDGGVHDLFTIVGRSDTPTGCTASVLPQPNFATQAANGNIIFRIPTPMFGAGLIEAISDDAILDNRNANAFIKSQLGISGQPNREGNAGTITRFGWKAQNKSLAIFAGEAYLVEQGVTSELFTQKRGEPGDGGHAQRSEPPSVCLTNALPEDATNFDATTSTGTMSDAVGFELFAQMLAPPQPATPTTSTQNGAFLFNQIGCGLCHTPSLTTGKAKISALANQKAALYSDLLVHNMGSGLADGVSQGGAGPDEFRTAPLWGLGQRIFFLHDGRTRDLVQAIEAHRSQGSEANQVVGRYNGLNAASQQDILNFLRSL
jgi:CxxC motif-containing protein (DUF1111 family)